MVNIINIEMYRNWQSQGYVSDNEDSKVQERLSKKLKEVCHKLKIITVAFVKLKLQVKDREREIQRLKKQNAAMKDISTFRNPRETIMSTNINSFCPENRYEYSSRDYKSYKGNQKPLQKELKAIKNEVQRFSQSYNKSAQNIRVFQVEYPINKVQNVMVPKIKINETDTFRKYDSLGSQNIASNGQNDKFEIARGYNLELRSKKSERMLIIKQQQVTKIERVRSEQSDNKEKKIKQTNGKEQDLLNKIWQQRDKEIQKMEEIWKSINQKLQAKEVSSILADENID